jgi:NAD-specific glutamate dehydrogenase
MSGDVFGNGMLLSKHIKLVGAFNHMHIFVDPDPDPAKSWEERKRLFDLPRSAWTDYDAKLISKGGGIIERKAKSSAWTDYDAKLISKGGGIIERKAKSVKLTAEMKSLFGLTQDQITPNDRHLREGERRDPSRRGRSGQRRPARRRDPGRRQGHRRGRQPGAHPAGAYRVRHGRRALQHGLDR